MFTMFYSFVESWRKKRKCSIGVQVDKLSRTWRIKNASQHFRSISINMINVIIKFDILIFSRILCGNNFVIPFSLLQIYIYIYIPRDFQIESKKKSRSFLRKRTFKEMWRWCLSSYRCAVKFPRSSSVREVEKSILPVCSTAEQEFSPFYCYTRAHTRTPRRL